MPPGLSCAEEESETPFEVNLMEALIGWKTWLIRDGILQSASFGKQTWPAETPFKAECHGAPTVFDPAGTLPACPPEECPREHHSCGIYAAEIRETAENYGKEKNHILGLVYGWGRYVRGTNGWRAQYAYPKCFYLREEQIEHFDDLKKYHVPIYVERPILMYNPEEDGYEYRRTEEDWDSGTAEEPDAEESSDYNSEED